MAELAVVVGAGAMGAAVAQRLAQSHRILLADLDDQRAESEVAKLRQDGAEAIAVQCDVTSPSSVSALAQRVGAEGGMQVLAHVAGLSPSMGDFDTIVRVNLVGPSLVTNSLLPQCGPGAAAIMISSVAAHLGPIPDKIVNVLRDRADDYDLPSHLRRLVEEDGADTNTAYRLSKFGLVMLCRRSARAWGERGARIVSLSPGIIASPMGAREFEANASKQQLFALSPQKREGTMREITDVVAFLASDGASFISGTDILVDGGLAGTISDVPFGLARTSDAKKE